MTKTDKKVKDLAEALSEALGMNVEILKINISKFNSEANAVAFKTMIEESFEAIKDIQNSDMSTEDKIKHLSLNFINASKVNKDDMKLLNKKEAERYINLLKSCGELLNSIINNIRSDIFILSKHCKDVAEEDNLESLSKEELIARIRGMK